MANTYTQLYVHFVFVVKYRQALLLQPWQQELFKYFTGIVQNQGHKMIQVNGVADHVHLLIGLNPVQSIADLMRVTKSDSSEWINKQGFCADKFRWQEGYGAFSCSRRELSRVADYIQNQEEHHRKKSMVSEYEGLLLSAGIEFNRKFIFKDPG